MQQQINGNSNTFPTILRYGFPVTEHSVLDDTRTSYDAVAALYAELVTDMLGTRPLERAMLAAFAELAGGRGPVADLGCGPGHLTAHLRSLGLDVFGLDLSPR